MARPQGLNAASVIRRLYAVLWKFQGCGDQHSLYAILGCLKYATFSRSCAPDSPGQGAVSVSRRFHCKWQYCVYTTNFDYALLLCCPFSGRMSLSARKNTFQRAFVDACYKPQQDWYLSVYLETDRFAQRHFLMHSACSSQTVGSKKMTACSRKVILCVHYLENDEGAQMFVDAV